eukprot:TRINITY_DN8465_c0_g1_i5.p1 TRINITY_DN8465_c0_g1~~TRINITY_DN8465_c0_g1_i5.p1  ORF type:complete len:364 (-),score=95.49 TRINITY_DN8465_c0_g1_i5:398-1489(-)
MRTVYFFLPSSSNNMIILCLFFFFFFQAEDGIRDAQESRGLGDVYKRQVQTSGCTKRNETIQKVAVKHNATLPSSQMRVVQSHIQADLNEQQVYAMLSSRKRPREEVGHKEAPAAAEDTLSVPRAVLVGLHTCGDLGPTVIKAFLRCEHAAALLNVGCCYNFLTVCNSDTQGAADCGYPLSERLREARYRPTRTGSLMLAGQAVHRWRSNPKSGSMFKAHFYRAVLQAVLKQEHPEFLRKREEALRALDNNYVPPEFSLKKVPAKLAKEWCTYVPAALERLGLENALTAEQLTSLLERHAHVEHQVAVFWTLRAVLAPAVETLLLLDRQLYLAEKQVKAELIPVFDPEISPRNFCCVAVKDVK